MSQVTEFALPETDHTWKQKCIKLQNELLEARIQQINLKRINRSLEDTLKIAMIDDLPDTQRNSTQRMNLTWKEKYEHQLQKNIENQNYIKVLQTKRNTSSSTKPNKKRQTSTTTRASFKTETQTRYRPIPLTPIDLYEDMNTRQLGRKSSVKKMEGFMERLMKEKYAISDFGIESYLQNCPIDSLKGRNTGCGGRDTIEKLFGAVKNVNRKENYYSEADQEILPLKVRHSYHENRLLTQPMILKQADIMLKRKLGVASYLR